MNELFFHRSVAQSKLEFDGVIGQLSPKWMHVYLIYRSVCQLIHLIYISVSLIIYDLRRNPRKRVGPPCQEEVEDGGTVYLFAFVMSSK